MSKSFSSLAIIINRSDWQESDRLILAYSKEFGKIYLLAKGARKFNSKLAAHTEPLNLSLLSFNRNKGHYYLIGAKIEEAYLNIKSSLEKFRLSARAFANFIHLIKGEEPDSQVFLWLKTWLASLEQASKEEMELEFQRDFRLQIFYWKLFRLLGYEAQLDFCANCGEGLQSGRNYFDFQAGGLLCSKCFKAESIYSPISDNCIKLLRLVNTNAWQRAKLNKSLIKEWAKLNEKLLNWWQ